MVFIYKTITAKSSEQTITRIVYVCTCVSMAIIFAADYSASDFATLNKLLIYVSLLRYVLVIASLGR